MMIRHPVRAGITLTEVLVAMFVMAIGMIALLTLFPLGAMQIGDALRMDRATQTAASADALLRMHWRHYVVQQAASSQNGRPADPFIWDAMDDPNLIQAQPGPPNPMNPVETLYLFQYLLPTHRLSGGPGPSGWGNADPNPISSTSLRTDIGNPTGVTNPGPPLAPFTALVTAHGQLRPPKPNPNRLPSFPVYIDSLGQIARAGTPGQFWMAGNSASVGSLMAYQRFLIPRRTLSTVLSNINLASNVFTLTDDLAFEQNGAPEPAGVLARQGRYSWAAIIQRPQFDNRLVADLKILVFDGRAPGIAGPEDEVVTSLGWVNPTVDPTQAVTAAPLYLVPGQKAIPLLLPARGANSPALIRRGGWLMDGTHAVDATNGLSGPRNIRNANFYRIVGVQAGEEGTGPGGTTPYLVDLETPIKGPVTDGPAEPPAQIYLFAHLTEVFERPALRLDDGN